MPTLLASAYLPKGAVCSLPLQHTSVLTTARRLFGIAGALTRRDAAAGGFESLFLAQPRSDAPATLTPAVAALRAAPDAAQRAPDAYMHDMAWQWRLNTGALPCAISASEPASQQAVHEFLRAQIQAFLDYRARGARARGRRRP